MTIDTKLIDDLVKDYKSPADVLGENGILKQFTKAILERAMQAELTTHLGYEKNDPAGHNTGNSRNGTSAKTLKGDFGELLTETPRDRNGSFSPKIVPKGKTRLDGFDERDHLALRAGVYRPERFSSTSKTFTVSRSRPPRSRTSPRRWSMKSRRGRTDP